MPRLSGRELASEISRELANDPDISTRAIAARLRARGVRGANERIRAIARVARQRSGLDANLQGALDVGREGFATNRQFAAAIREFGGDIDREAERTNPTHVAIQYTATVRYRVTFYGDQLETGTETLRGTVVQPIDAYRPELIAERVASNLVQIITQRVGSGTTTYIEGLDVQILASDVRVDSAELRGSARRAAARRGR